MIEQHINSVKSAIASAVNNLLILADTLRVGDNTGKNFNLDNKSVKKDSRTDMTKIDKDCDKLERTLAKVAFRIVKENANIIDVKLLRKRLSNVLHCAYKKEFDAIAKQFNSRAFTGPTTTSGWMYENELAHDIISDAVERLCSTVCLQWHDLVMTCKGYKRIVKIVTAIQAMQNAKNLGADLDIGLNKLPNQWPHVFAKH